MTADAPKIETNDERRRRLLGRLREVLPQAESLPGLDEAWLRYDDPAKQFADTLRFVGGQCERVATLEDARTLLLDLPHVRQAKRVYSWFPGWLPDQANLDAVERPHDLEDVDFAVLPGYYAVAENAAVWVTEEGLKHRSLYFIAQHLALIVPMSRLVDNLHQAYAALADRGAFSHPGFSAWISGPSKTADIEQSLVIGAHGARSLVVVLTDEDFLPGSS